MKLYHITQDKVSGYDTYSDAIVAAETPDDARNTHPNENDNWNSDTWVNNSSDVTATLIGFAVEGTKAGVICSSFHAG